MTDRRDAALQYLARGWWPIPVNQAKEGLVWWAENRNLKRPTAQRVEAWFRKNPTANVAILTGCRSRLGVLDVDGPAGAAALKALVEQWAVPKAAFRDTLQASSGRAEGGRHYYFALPEGDRLAGSAGDGLEWRGDGNLIVAPPSIHKSGAVYAWRDVQAVPLPLPAELRAWLTSRGATRQRKVKAQVLPPHLAGRPERDLVRAALRGSGQPPDADIAATLTPIPNPDLDWDLWAKVGLAVWAACSGGEGGLAAYHAWSAKSRKYDYERTEEKWRQITSCPPTEIGFGSLIHMAREAIGDPAWLPPSQRVRETPSEPEGDPPAFDPTTHTETNGHHFPFGKVEQEISLNPLSELNKKHAVIADVGGKCLVLNWIPSKVDEAVKIASFQSFKSFAERYANRYVIIKKENKDGETTEKAEQLGAHWLKWAKRKTYEGIDLDPAGAEVLPNGFLNLWRGFAVAPAAGRWDLMRHHIGEVLAAGDAEAMRYILRFAAWAVQHPGERAEVALVFRGGKGSGKGTFANALKRLFGAHGLQIFSSKHLVGAFNGHLRSTLLLFADEAFWAGDKQGESVLKGMLTEPTLMIEQKGVDAAPWKNRLHVIMSANADWVVPASHDERRYAVFSVSNARVGDQAYFKALHAEINAGGLAAMLWDLQRVDLQGWHPREILHTEALREQKARSLDPKNEWWEELLQSGQLPGPADKDGYIPASTIYRHAREHSPRLRDTSDTSLGRFLRDNFVESKHKTTGNVWRFPALNEARKRWVDKFNGWGWRDSLENWGD